VSRRCTSFRVCPIFRSRQQGTADDLPLPPVSDLIDHRRLKLIILAKDLTEETTASRRSYDPKWKLSRTKTLFNGFNVEMEKEGGWNSN
jgi:hypothetical protein